MCQQGHEGISIFPPDVLILYLVTFQIHFIWSFLSHKALSGWPFMPQNLLLPQEFVWFLFPRLRSLDTWPLLLKNIFKLIHNFLVWSFRLEFPWHHMFSFTCYVAVYKTQWNYDVICRKNFLKVLELQNMLPMNETCLSNSVN